MAIFGRKRDLVCTVLEDLVYLVFKRKTKNTKEKKQGKLVVFGLNLTTISTISYVLKTKNSQLRRLSFTVKDGYDQSPTRLELNCLLNKTI